MRKSAMPADGSSEIPALRPARPPLHAWHALILHEPHRDAEAVERQLRRIGLSIETCWPELAPLQAAADVVFFDADRGCDGQFPWPKGQPPMPLVALIGSEAPGRVEWALQHGSHAHLIKPIASAGVYSALLIAAHAFETRRHFDATLATLTARLRKRPAVVRAILEFMREGLDEEAAAQRLRSFAMERGLTIEDGADLVLQAGGRAAGRSRSA